VADPAALSVRSSAGVLLLTAVLGSALAGIDATLVDIALPQIGRTSTRPSGAHRRYRQEGSRTAGTAPFLGGVRRRGAKAVQTPVT